jgi:hypothetical protein
MATATKTAKINAAIFRGLRIAMKWIVEPLLSRIEAGSEFVNARAVAATIRRRL